MLGVSRPTVDRLVHDGMLPSVDLGATRRTLIPASAVEELGAKATPTTTPPEPCQPSRRPSRKSAAARSFSGRKWPYTVIVTSGWRVPIGRPRS